MMGQPRASDEQERIDREASDWVMLAEERPLTPAEEAALAAWRAADPRHDRTYRAMLRTWGELPALQELAALAPLDDMAAPEPAPARTPRFAARRWAAAVTALAAVLLALLAVPALLNPASESYATDLAELRRLTLEDGSIVTLGAKSRIEVRIGEGERRVLLKDGEAFFEVAHDPRRPFVVDAGSSLVRVLGTKFDINRASSGVRVAVLEGVVQVSEKAPAGDDAEATAPPRLLRAGQRIELAARPAAPAAVATAAPQAPLPAQAPGAWREGKLVYDNVRIADLIADVNRYYAPGVTIADPQAGELRITAAFRTDEIESFLEALDRGFPVEVDGSADQGFRVKMAAR